MSTVRAKFKVAQIKEEAWVDAAGAAVYSVVLYPVVGGSSENDSFFAATPGGSLNLAVVRKATADSFVVGDEYYVDLTPVPQIDGASRNAQHG